MAALLIMLTGTLPAAQTGPTPAHEQIPLEAVDRITGEVTLGWRFLVIDGSKEQYDEQVNKQPGVLLRAFALEGNPGPASALEHFCLAGRGFGDPDSSANLSLDMPTLRARADWTRTSYVGNVGDDLHRFDFSREQARMRIDSMGGGSSDTHGGIALHWARRDGLSMGTRSVGSSYIPGVPVHRSEDAVGMDADVRADLGGVDVSVESGIERLESRDRRSFLAPSPFDPAETHREEFGADGTGWSRRLGIRLGKAAAAGRLTVDCGFSYSRSTTDANERSSESGILSSADDEFERTRNNASDAVSRDFECDAGVCLKLTPDTRLSGRFRHLEEREEGVLDRYETLFYGGSAIEGAIQQSLTFERRASIAEGRMETALGSAVQFDLRLSYGSTNQSIRETSGAITIHEFEGGLDEYGGRAQCSLALSSSCSLSVSGGYEIAPTNTALGEMVPSFESDTDEFVETKVRWRPRLGLNFAATLRHSERSSDAFDSSSTVDSASLSAACAFDERWTADASWTTRIQRTSADTLQLLPLPAPTLVPTTVQFEEVAHVATFGGSYALTSRLRPRLGMSLALADGDVGVQQESIDLDLPYRWQEHSTIGIEVELHDLQVDDGDSLRGFTSRALVLYIQAGF